MELGLLLSVSLGVGLRVRVLKDVGYELIGS